MRIDNNKTFDNINKYKTYRLKSKIKQNNEEIKASENVFIGTPLHTQPVFSKANQVIVDNSDGSREMFLTVATGNYDQIFTRIKISDSESLNIPPVSRSYGYF